MPDFPQTLHLLPGAMMIFVVEERIVLRWKAAGSAAVVGSPSLTWILADPNKAATAQLTVTLLVCCPQKIHFATTHHGIEWSVRRPLELEVGGTLSIRPSQLHVLTEEGE